MSRNENSETARRILDAAAEVFAEKGFRGATTREIASKAGANIASLHYYYRDKEGLYLEVLGYLLDRSLEDLSLPAAIDELDMPPELLLELFIQGALSRAVDRRASLAWTLFLHEMIEPSFGKELMVERVAKPVSTLLRKIVAKLLGDAATDEKTRLCSLSVASMILYQRLARPMVESLMPDADFSSPEGVSKLAAHIARFSLAAIKAEKESSNA